MYIHVLVMFTRKGNPTTFVMSVWELSECGLSGDFPLWTFLGADALRVAALDAARIGPTVSA